MKNHLKTILAFVSLAFLAIGHAADSTATLTAHSVPDAIKAPAANSFAFAANARGVQIYVCQPKKDDPTQFEWAFKAPEAELFDAAGKQIGKHYAGPTWESTDGSKVLGELKSKADAPEFTAIPWLLVGAKSHEGEGLFSKVSVVQRVDTTGGKAPTTGAVSTSAGQEIRVPYTATYYFYLARP